MKIYIPFNSNNFNSVFTTLSISPVRYYTNRRYSFKRASGTILNEDENLLVGFERPVFHNREFDKDNGFPILLEIDIDSNKCKKIQRKGFNYYAITSTIYLFGPFRLIFRHKKELQETIAKSLKSLETKFADLAIDNSDIIEEECFINDIPKLNLYQSKNEVHPDIFFNERRLNRVFGSILGSSIAYSNSTSKEIQEVVRLVRLLNNNVSLFLNKLGTDNRYEREIIFQTLSSLKYIFQSFESVDEAIVSKSSMTIDSWNLLKNSKIFNVPAFEIILEGILNMPNIDLPIILKIEKLQRIIGTQFSNNPRSVYIKTVNSTVADIKYHVDKLVVLSKASKKLNPEHVIEPKFIGGKLLFNIPDTLSTSEDVLLKNSLLYFIENDDIYNVDQFFINRKTILVDLAKHFKNNIQDFDDSEARIYLLNLLKSFDDLRSGFNISSTNNSVLKSLAILFTSGRDFLKFVENNEKEGIDSAIIYYSIWGSIYGAAIFPKTMTEVITNDRVSVRTLIAAFDKALRSFIPRQNTSSHVNDLNDSSYNNRSLIRNYVTATPDENNTGNRSFAAIKLLEFIQDRKKVRLSDLKSFYKDFKKISDIETFIMSELSEFVVVKKESRTMYAIYKSNNHGLFE